MPAEYQPQVILAYNSAIVDVFYIALALVSVGLIAALGLKWRSIKKDDEKKERTEKRRVALRSYWTVEMVMRICI